MMNIESKQWIFIALTLTIAIGGGSYLYQQHKETQSTTSCMHIDGALC